MPGATTTATTTASAPPALFPASIPGTPAMPIRLPPRHAAALAATLAAASLLSPTSASADAASAPVAPASATATAPRLVARTVAPGVEITGQLALEAVPLAANRYVTIVDLRPDGEGAGQPPSAQVGAAAQALKMDFRYVPVAPGEIPQAAVDRVRETLAQANGPVLLYCRSGSRAARTWALAEASRPGGAGVEQILAAVKAAGQDASDLRGRLELAVAARAPK